MAFKADCGASTVLEAPCVTSTSRFLVAGEFWTALRNSATPTVGSRWRIQIGGGKFEIRNSKFEIHCDGRHSEFRIPNSEFVLPSLAAVANSSHIL